MKAISRTHLVRFTVALVVVLLATPAFAQIDLSGDWRPIRSEDNFEGHPFAGEYMGLPVNDAARMKGDTWSASWVTLPEWQCRPHGIAYVNRDPSRIQLERVIDPVTRETTAWRWNTVRGTETWIYMDGRGHPSPNAPHTWNGYSTGEWVGNALRIRTTHLKENIIRRNGLPASDEAEVVRYIRRRDNIMTDTTIVYDPLYLTEPLVRTTEYRNAPTSTMSPYPCYAATEIIREKGEVPHYLLGDHPQQNEYSFRFQVPLHAARGGVETIYPEFQQDIRTGEIAESIDLILREEEE